LQARLNALQPAWRCASTPDHPGDVVMPAIVLRAASEEDIAFLFRVYASTREGELAPLAWSDEQKHAFVAMQFDAQHRHYRTHFPDARFDVIEVGGAPAGRFYVDRSDQEIRVIDLALLPEYRGAGIGGTLLHELQVESARQATPIVMHVEHHNRAVRLYRRLEFRVVADDGVYQKMIWTPPSIAARS
jgi:ribosomal protein S18 acetylase RimI-like enzyme